MLSNAQYLVEELGSIDAAMQKAETDYQWLLEKVHPSHTLNARNLLHYLVLRSHDMRHLQDRLHAAGLSSLANSESHIRGQLLEVLQRLGKTVEMGPDIPTYEKGRDSSRMKSTAIFGERKDESIPPLMITFQTGFADDYDKVKGLLQSGMNLARINCAQDDEPTWFRMIQHVKRASEITGIPCRIYMDLAGPKIRTITKKKKDFEISEGQSIWLTDKRSLKEAGKDAIGCTIPAIATQLKVGERVLFDDGVVEGRVESIEGNRAKLQIMRISKKPLIRTKKGINFPDSSLIVPAFTKFDRECLPFIRENADLVGYSFVRNASDVSQLQEVMGKENPLALVLKIETLEAVNNLPSLLFQAMRQENVGVMIARGDLAVEIGFERMSEVQEEILWICEAAHIPVIWATQVLDNLNKSGLATRSEITDAAHSSMADCVMINKGKHLVRVLETLKDILKRSGAHHVKKRHTFRSLQIAKRFLMG